MSQEETGKERILIVEDDPPSRELLIRRLGNEGFATGGACDGPQALADIEQRKPDLVLLDIHLPGMDGLEVLASIRKTRPIDQLPVIFVTAMTDTTAIVKGLDSGANDYVTKPIVFSVLLARVESALKIRRNVMALLEAERQRVMLESLGAACHHLSQPMSAVIGNLELLLKGIAQSPAEGNRRLQDTLNWAMEVKNLIHRLQEITLYRTTPYIDGENILDIGKD